MVSESVIGRRRPAGCESPSVGVNGGCVERLGRDELGDEEAAVVAARFLAARQRDRQGLTKRLPSILLVPGRVARGEVGWVWNCPRRASLVELEYRRLRQAMHPKSRRGRAL